MWRNLKFLHMWSNLKCLHMTDVEKSEMSFIISDLHRFVGKLFCRDLCAIAWRKFEPKILPVEKNYKYEVWRPLSHNFWLLSSHPHHCQRISANDIHPLNLSFPIIYGHAFISLIDATVKSFSLPLSSLSEQIRI